MVMMCRKHPKNQMVFIIIQQVSQPMSCSFLMYINLVFFSVTADSYANYSKWL
jgi:hypothetical protein